MTLLIVLAALMSPEPMLVSAVVTLAGFIAGCLAYLRTVDARQQRQLTRMEEKLDECELDRNELWEALTNFGVQRKRRN